MNRPPCPRTDDVLAVHLDGDVDGTSSGWSGLEALADHLRDCAGCQRELQRARRLDAALAEGAGRAAAAHAAADGSLDALLGRLCAPERLAAEAATVAVRSPRRTVVRAGLAALATIAGLAGIWSAAAATSPPERNAVSPIEVAALEAAPVAAAERNATSDEVAPRAAVPPPLQVADSAVRARPQVAASTAPDDLAELERFVDPAASLHARLAAVQRLFGGERPRVRLPHEAMLALVHELAPGCAGPAGRIVMAAAHDGVRGNAPFVQWLRAALQRIEATRGPVPLDDVAALLVGSRLGVPELDAAVLRVLRRHPEHSATVAAALRSDLRRHGAGDLLLDAWSDLVERGQQQDDVATAGLWFADQPAAVYSDVAAALATARSSPRRVRCLLALQWSSDPAHTRQLDQRARGGNHTEALAAGRERHAASD